MLLLRVVREVAESAGLEEPASISQRRWETARDAHHRWSDAPPARRITERIGLPWSKALEAAFSTIRGQEVVLSQMTRVRDEDNSMTSDYCVYALRLIAQRLGSDTIYIHEYKAERDRLMANDARRWLHGRQLRLPTDAQVVVVFHSWSAALAAAGLSPLPRVGWVHRAPTIIDLLDRCYAIYGTQPSARELKAFARGNGIAFPFIQTRKWSEEVADWKQTLSERGLPVPDGLPPRDQRPSYGDDVGAKQAGERGRENWTERAVCVEWVARYLRELEAGRRASVRDYRAWRRANPGAPTFDTIYRHGGWGVVRQDAEVLIADQG